MGILSAVIVGFVVGVVARFIHPGRESIGLVVTTLLGIAGSLVASFLGQALGWYAPDQPAGFIGAVVGAVILLFIYSRIRGRATA